jgi:hypothetical protein
MILGPLARDRDGHLVRLRPVENPVPDGGEPLDHIEGMLRTVGVDLKLGHVDP